MDNSVDGILAQAVAASFTEQNADWSFFVHKIKRTQNRQLQPDENRSAKLRFHDMSNQPIVHKHLALAA
ncbi:MULTISPECIES: hypothetical protein [Pseudomonas]|uniref:Uncharacterized protein n=1 Tax=Pseudomonas yamanorum TaxID=515393 RepID=A0A7Y8K5M0_9PSED|nr:MULTISPECIES: hypothetical protein [Pseudomonas]MCS3415804.1 hypothetical protein [Pseudomonas sp. BIGb0558]MCS3434789.1 hypothetical protein [Pseudomonas sp. BIGb0450]NVZ81718.1 hypothetical protein [Pseudomonas yamanorum]NWD21715.1 hypothetical protein [Pseudomonas yamanorum]NWE76962.1 hypothetical protein [Pseudomonas yamanorum]